MVTKERIIVGGSVPGSAVFSLSSMAPVSKKTPPPPLNTSSENWAMWGTDNNEPAQRVETVSKNAVLGSALEFRKAAHIGNGLLVYEERIGDDGTITKIPVKDERIDKFIQNSNLHQVYENIVDDYYLHANYFPELIGASRNNEIVAINRRDPVYCRWERIVEGKEINYLFFSYNFPNPTEKKVLKIPALNNRHPYWHLKNEIKNIAGKSYILPMRSHTRGQVYYNQGWWHGLEDGWLEIANDIPLAVKSIMQNQMILKWHIQINYSYWNKVHDNWDNLSEKQKEEKIQETVTNMNNYLTDTDNAGKSFISFFTRSEINEKDMLQDIIITPLDNKLKDLKYITEFQNAANSEILFGIGLDGTLVGQNSPGGSESGSGSNKREAMWINQQLVAAHRRKTIEPWWSIVRDFNGWPSEWKMGIREIDSSQTLDKNPSKTQNII